MEIQYISHKVLLSLFRQQFVACELTHYGIWNAKADAELFDSKYAKDCHALMTCGQFTVQCLPRIEASSIFCPPL